MYRLIIGEYHQNSSRRYAVGIMAFTWCLATFFIVNIYSSCLTSYLSLTFQRPDINSFEAGPDYRQGTPRHVPRAPEEWGPRGS